MRDAFFLLLPYFPCVPGFQPTQGGVLVAAQGLGKTMLARNIVHAAVLQGYSALFIEASRMLLDLGAQDSARSLERRLRHYTRPALLCIDEVGYLSFGARAADLLFEVVSRRYEQKSIVITTNLAFSDWPTIFPNASCVTALIDRLTHHAEMEQGAVSQVRALATDGHGRLFFNALFGGTWTIKAVAVEDVEQASSPRSIRIGRKQERLVERPLARDRRPALGEHVGEDRRPGDLGLLQVASGHDHVGALGGELGGGVGAATVRDYDLHVGGVSHALQTVLDRPLLIEGRNDHCELGNSFQPTSLEVRYDTADGTHRLP